MARPGEIKIAVKNRQDSAQEKDYLFFNSSGRICHVQQNFNQKSTRYQFRISGGISQTIDDTKKAEVILNAPVIVSHNEGMKALHRVTQPTNR